MSVVAAVVLSAGLAQSQTGQTPLTALDLVNSALERNRAFLSSRQRVAEAQALLRQAGVRPAPAIEVESGTGRPLGTSGENEYSAAFFQPIETFGKRDKRILVAQKAVELAEAELEEHKRQLVFDVRMRFIQAVANEQKLEVIDRLLPINRENYRLTATRVSLGDAAPLEQDLLLVDLNRSEAQQAVFSGRASASLAELKTVAGFAPSDSLQLASDLAVSDVDRTLAELQQHAVQHRPDLRILAILEAQAAAEAELARAEGRPDLTASVRYTHRNSSFDQLGISKSGPLVPLHDRDNVVTFGLAIPLVTQQRTQGAVDAALARETSTRLRREHLEQAVRLEVEAAYRRWRAAKRAVEILRTGVLEQSDKNLTVIREAYRLGQLRLLDVLNEQRRLVETQLAYIDAQTELAQSLAELEKAVVGIIQ